MSHEKDNIEKLSKSIQELTENVTKIANHLTIEKRWYQKIGIKDITLLSGVILFIFAFFEFKDTYTKFQQRDRMVQSIANTGLRLSQDLVFRPDGADVKKQIIDTLIQDARQLSPQDPDLLSVYIYSQFMSKVRNPNKDDLMQMDAYITFINRLKLIEDNRPFYSRIFENKNEQIITPGRFLQKLYYLGAAAFLNYISINNLDIDYKKLLFSKSDEYIRNGLSIAKKENDKVYKAQLLTLRIEYYFIGLDLKYDFSNQIISAFDLAEKNLLELKISKNKNNQLTGYDGISNIEYLRGKYYLKVKNHKKSIIHFKNSLKLYDEVREKFPDKINIEEVKKVKKSLLELTNNT